MGDIFLSSQNENSFVTYGGKQIHSQCILEISQVSLSAAKMLILANI